MTSGNAGLSADIERVEAIWNDCRARFGQKGGPWLFGEYSVADALYAPVVLRFNTYGAPQSEAAREYVATTLEDPAMQSWLQDAGNEPWKLAKYEGGSAN
jgi:glutathione S-transferase